MKKSSAILVSLISIVLVICFAWGALQFAATRPHAVFGTSVDFVIAPGEKVWTIGNNLKSIDLISSPIVFLYEVVISGSQHSLQAGTYKLKVGTSISEIVNVLSRGDKSSREVSITIVEGWTTEDIATYLAEKGLFTHDEFIAALSSYVPDTAQLPFLKDKPANRSLEGYLFPDTYRIFRDSTPDEVITKMLKNFGERLTPAMQKEVSAQGKTIFDIVRMASVVEREVSQKEDRRIVSGIFYKRIEQGIPLQSDATVNYVTGKGKASPSFDDLKVESLYNTYLHDGLPYGPIGNPGTDAIDAAINPESSPYLFYLSTPEGVTVYAATFEEHKQNKAKYLK